MWNLKKSNSQKQSRMVVIRYQAMGKIGRFGSKCINFNKLGKFWGPIVQHGYGTIVSNTSVYT